MSWGLVAVAAATVVGAAVNKNSSDKAIKSQQRASDKASAQIEGSTSLARDDINRLFPQAQQSSQQGFQGALDVFGQSLPAQSNVFQQGNVGAQQAILQGLPQIQNALLGNNVDFSQMQPFQVQQPDMSFFQQTLPQEQPIQSPLSGQMGPFIAENPLAGVQNKPSEIDKFLGFNKAVLENDPANRLSKKAFSNAKKIAKKDPVTRGLKKLFSDERLKENIQKVGELAGQDLYTWTWKDTPETKSFAGDSGVGFIAQEIEKTLPGAISETESGYKKIDLSVIFEGK